MRLTRTTSVVLLAVCCGLLIVGSGTGTVAEGADRARKRGGADPNATEGLRTVRSPNFIITTDLSAQEAEELITRLETMLRLVAGYWGRPHRGVIPMFVAKDIGAWPAAQIAQMDPAGVRSIQQGGGVTLSRVAVRGNEFRSDAVVYASAHEGTPQHEAVHAYCAHVFGTTGPVWYSEGMAEVGNYWQEKDDKSVQAPLQIIEYLKQGDPKPLQQIVDNPLETTGDSWQNYASRWALCHLLGHNENYSRRFKPLGLQLLDLSSRDISFWQVYGPFAQEINFEYRLFLKNLEPGYRVDLCSWDWKTKFRPPRGDRAMVSDIRADHGWQASRLRVIAETEYEYLVEGKWSISKGGPEMSAAGNETGQGRLVGILFSDYELSEPFDLGEKGTWTAPESGDLFVRCAEDWGQLGDNQGRVKLRMKLAGRRRPLSSEQEADDDAFSDAE